MPPDAKVDNRCRVCGGEQLDHQVVSRPDKRRKLVASICQRCGHVALPGNFHDYTEAAAPDDFGLKPRVGTEETPGREFGMAQLGITALHNAGVLPAAGADVLVYGAGRSVDNRHIEKLDAVRNVAIGDISKVRDDAEFVDISQPATRRFDLVIASEVIEHFLEPNEEFPRLFGYVADNGLLVCSTNIYDGGRLAKHGYIWGRGHVAYYSPEALRVIADGNGMRLDFRVPLAATGSAGPRKRYVLFSRSDEVMRAVSVYFGRATYAPSEPPAEKKPGLAAKPASRAVS
ncbi:MAG TPA: methyltransferase domain-containing protein [Mycobacteriales bacterium]|nr:methyltransferase domain-containing protein [Mycobacteriales bacterium]